jgi:hypothetical protein
VGLSRVSIDVAPALPASLELMVFEHSAERARQFVSAGLRTFLIDWEHLGKDERQQGFDTEIRLGTATELRDVAAIERAEVWCRLNRRGSHTPAEIQRALDAGAAGLFLPMVTGPDDVEVFVRLIDGRARCGILVETAEALDRVTALARYPVHRVYFGLNDFAISRGGGSIFRAILDGSVQRVREAFHDVNFGFGGVTAVDAGDPVPCRHLIEEMARLDCGFCFVRRSFRRDLSSRSLASMIEGIHSHWRLCRARDAAAVARDHGCLETILRELL